MRGRIDNRTAAGDVCMTNKLHSFRGDIFKINNMDFIHWQINIEPVNCTSLLGKKLAYGFSFSEV